MKGLAKDVKLRGLRVALGGVSLGISLVSGVALLLPTAGLADSGYLAADRQSYVSDSGPDAYQASSASEGGVTSSGSLTADPVDVHVAASATQVLYHSLMHIELDGIPSDATVQQLNLTLVPTQDPTRSKDENVNTSGALLDAYPLKTELPANFNPEKDTPPAADTTAVEVVGKLNSDGSWSFDLSKMLPYWKTHGNTGAAILPNPNPASGAWSIGFDRTITKVQVSYAAASTGGSNLVPAQTQQTQPAPVPDAGSAVISNAGPVFGAGAPPGSLTTQAPAAASPAARSSRPSRSGGAQATQPAGNGPGSVPLWLLALGVSATAAVGLLAQPVSQALSAGGGFGPGLLSQLRLHPRMFAVAGAMTLWSSTLGVYANTIGRNVLGPQPGQVASGTDGGGSDGTVQGTTDNGTPTPGATGAGGGTTTGTTGTTSSGQPLTGAAAYLNSPNAPHPPSAQLFGPSDNTVGITNTTIQMCAHAALTFGPAFNIGASDLNVFWQMVDAQGGVWGRKIVQPDGTPGIPFQDDGYQPSKAVTAAQACHDQQGGDFVLLGGIGFDQIPAVRVWAEQNHMIYIHHIATQNGSQGLRYSYTMLPTLEKIGTQYGEYYVGRDAGSKLGIVYRNSSNWDPGRVAFDDYLKQTGHYGDVKVEAPVTNNQGDYTREITEMQAAGVNTVFIYENALAAEQFIQQSHNQNYNPHWIMFPFNLTLNTLAQAGVDTSHMDGVIPWPSYTCNASADPRYSAYKAELQKFEAAYHQYDPNANLCGDGGDLLFGTWLAWEQVYDLLYQCGPGCTRNNIAGLMQSGYHATVGANCAVDFRGTDGHHGGGPEDIDKVETVNTAGRGNGPAWVTTALCQNDLQ